MSNLRRDVRLSSESAKTRLIHDSSWTGYGQVFRNILVSQTPISVRTPLVSDTARSERIQLVSYSDTWLIRFTNAISCEHPISLVKSVNLWTLRAIISFANRLGAAPEAGVPYFQFHCSSFPPQDNWIQYSSTYNANTGVQEAARMVRPNVADLVWLLIKY